MWWRTMAHLHVMENKCVKLFYSPSTIVEVMVRTNSDGRTQWCPQIHRTVMTNTSHSPRAGSTIMTSKIIQKLKQKKIWPGRSFFFFRLYKKIHILHDMFYIKHILKSVLFTFGSYSSPLHSIIQILIYLSSLSILVQNRTTFLSDNRYLVIQS